MRYTNRRIYFTLLYFIDSLLVYSNSDSVAPAVSNIFPIYFHIYSLRDGL